MCGRIALYEEPGHMARMLDAGISPESLAEWAPKWNVGPQSEIFGVSVRGGRRVLDAYRWGLVPSWTKDPKALRSTFNARAETLAARPMFRSAFATRRILVPVNAFYEWQAIGPREKQPYAFTRANGSPVVFAGLRERWLGSDGAELRTATIITIAAGPDMEIHDRQPVVLERKDWSQWLDPAVSDPKVLRPLLRATEAGTLVAHPVGKGVGNIRNDRPELLEAVALEGDPGANSM